MDGESIRILDDVNQGDIIEVHHIQPDLSVRTKVGAYAGIRLKLGDVGRDWYLLMLRKPSIPIIDIQQIRILKRISV